MCKNCKKESITKQVERLQKDLDYAGGKGTAVVKSASLKEVLDFVVSSVGYSK